MDRDDVVAVAQRRSSCWIGGKEETNASPATPDESLYCGFWRLKGGGDREQKVKYHPPFYVLFFFFFQGFSCNGLLGFFFFFFLISSS